MRSRDDLRNVAIVAHVDHGKTTLVDGMLRQTGAFRADKELTDRVLDSGRPRTRKGHHHPGQAHRRAVRSRPRSPSSTPPATPTSAARWSGAWPWSTGCCCSSTPRRARCPRPASSCARRSKPGSPSILVVNKVDRADARIAEVVHEVEDLFLDLDADEHQVGFPVLYANARAGWASTDRRHRRHRSRPALRHHRAQRARSRLRPRSPPAGPGDEPRRLALRGSAGHLPGPQRDAAAGRHGGLVPGGRLGREGQGHRALRLAGPRTGRRRRRRARARSWPWPASPRSPSARPWPTPTTRGRCRPSWWTSPAWP